MRHDFHVFFGIFTVLLWWESASLGQEASGPATPAEEEEAVQVSIIAGGSSHEFARQAAILRAGLTERLSVPLQWTLHFDDSGRSDVEMASLAGGKWAEGSDIVIHLHCFPRVTDPVYVERILAPHREGLPALLIHGALHSFRGTGDSWFDFCGVETVSHRAERGLPVEVTGTGHPAVAGIRDWESPGEELYLVRRERPGIEVLAEAVDRESGDRHPVMWSHEFGAAKARVFATSLGNDVAGLSEAAFLDTLARAFLWTLDLSPAGKLIDLAPADSLASLPGPEERRSFLEPGISATRGGEASAMSEDIPGGHPAGAAIDGNGGTYWAAAGPGPSVWEVQLPEMRSVSALAVVWRDVQPPAYVLEGSLDGVEWFRLAEGGSGTGPVADSLHYFPPAALRAVRVSIPQTRPGEVPGIRELSAYETKDEIPAAFIHAAGLSDGLRAVGVEGVAHPLRLHPDWTVSNQVRTLPDVIQPLELHECANGALFVLGRRESGETSVYFLASGAEGGAGGGVFLSGLAADASMTWDGEWLYLLENGLLSKYRDTNGDGKADERHRLAGLFSPDEAAPALSGMQLALDGWIYAVTRAERALTGSDAAGRPVNLPRHGIVRFRRDGKSFQRFVSSEEPVHHLRSLGNLSFAAESGPEERQPKARFIQYGVFPGRPLESFPALPPSRNRPGMRGNFVYAPDGESEISLLAEMEGLAAVFPVSTGFVALVEQGESMAALAFRRSSPADGGEEAGGAVPVEWDSLRGMALFPLLGSPSSLVQQEAVFEILRRRRDWRNEVETLVQDRKSPSYLPSLALLSQMEGQRTFALLSDAARLSHQAGAFRLLGDRKEVANHRVLGEIMRATDPEVTTEILAVIARSGSELEGLEPLVLRFAAVENEALAGTAREWLIQQDAAALCFAVLDAEEEPALRRAALAVLSRIPKATVVEGLVLRLEQTMDHEFREAGLRALCELYFVKNEPWGGTALIDAFLRASLTDRRVETARLLGWMLEKGIPVRDLDALALAAEERIPLQPAVVSLMQEQGTVPTAAKRWLDDLVGETSHDPSLRARALALLIGEQEDFRPALRRAGAMLEESLIPEAREMLLQRWMIRDDLAGHEPELRRIAAEDDGGEGLLARETLRQRGVAVPEPVAVAAADETSAPGDPYERGFLVFERYRCGRCHNIHGEGPAIGPDLVAWAAANGPEALAEALATPSQKVADGFRTEILELKNGTRLRGIIFGEVEGKLRLADSAGNRFVVPLTEVRTRSLAEGSLMSEKVAVGIPAEELSDLRYFLRKLGGDAVVPP